VTEEAGLGTFRHCNGMSGELYFAENIGAGLGLVDVDQDGDLDLYLVQGTVMGSGKTLADVVAFDGVEEDLRDRLFLNEGTGPNGVPRFRDGTEAAGILASGYGMGVAAGDVNNDGFPDLYITNFGPNQLFRNRGDGTFEDVTAIAGVEDSRWSTAASFFDYDRDGWLELYVGGYLDFDPSRHETCRAESGAPDYCSPEAYNPLPDRLFHNRGDGTFEDVTAASGIGSVLGPALGSVTADLDGDGWVDLYVGNDQKPNFLFRNRGDGTFEEVALLAGSSVNREGRAEASMGLDAADLDGDRDLDLFMTHLGQESNTLYLNDGDGVFRDRSFESGLGIPSIASTGFGTRASDLDGDGDLDLLVANGSVKILEEQRRRGDLHPLRERNQLFLNLGDGSFEEAQGAFAGSVFDVEAVSRGAAFGDLDNDGDVDVVLSQNHGPVRLLLNQSPRTKPWIGLRLVAGEAGQDMLGALVEARRSDGRILVRRSHTDGSYLSSSDPRVLLGLGMAATVEAEAQVGKAIESVRVTWPDGTSESWQSLEVGAYTSLRQGQGLRENVGS